jgi:hypothetical protein
MKRSTTALNGVLVCVTPSVARADTVTDWNQTAIEVMKATRIGGNPWSRTLAMVHVAMADAINSTQGRYALYIASAPATLDASADAAAATAARQILVELHPSQKAMSDAAYTASLKARAKPGVLESAGNSLNVGDDMGGKIAAYLIESSLKPIR